MFNDIIIKMGIKVREGIDFLFFFFKAGVVIWGSLVYVFFFVLREGRGYVIMLYFVI